MPRVRNYVRTGEGPNGWMVMAMAEDERDVVERLDRRCDSCGVDVVMTPDAPPAFVLLSGKLCYRACATNAQLPDPPGLGDSSA
jgi:ferredoxin